LQNPDTDSQKSTYAAAVFYNAKHFWIIIIADDDISAQELVEIKEKDITIKIILVFKYLAGLY
jgi:hypothetical protein